MEFESRPESRDVRDRIVRQTEADDEFSIPENIPPVSVGITLVYAMLLAIGTAWCYAGSYPLMSISSVSECALEMLVATGVGLSVVVSVGVIWKYTRLFRSIEIELASRLGHLSPGGVIRLALLSSVAEEILFRGALQISIDTGLGGDGFGLKGYVLTSLIFGLLHTLPKGRTRSVIPWTVFATISGFVLGGAFIMTRNLAVPIIIHFIINSVNMWLIVERAQRRSRDAVTS